MLNLSKRQSKTFVKCPTWANVKAKHLLNAQLGQTPKQNRCQMPNVGKRQSKTGVKCPTWANVKANDGGLSDTRAKRERVK
ncbi:hypothetical protein [Segatella baroniae]|uniref:hypothetical protein n=1 Tax=Segatella baroniae TaxID=305719 RepID=UPI0012B5F07B|nr:hypothetical protein [Segatella baroniae]